MSRGFTLVETVVAIGVLVIFFAGITAILHMSLTNYAQARVRTVAMGLAEDRLEMARNLPFDSVGTVGGIPSGSLKAEEQVELNGQTFTLTTSVVFIDDPFDGLAPSDIIPTDYKRVKVSVVWDGPFAPQTPLLAMSDVSPKGLERADGTGTLLLYVYNSQGDPVTNAQVHIEAEGVSPSVNLDTLSDADGRVLLPGALPCINCYQVTVTRANWTTDRTYGTNEVTTPHKPHLSVFEADVTQASFGIDSSSTVTFRVYRKSGSSYVPFQGVVLDVVGTKEIGRTSTDDPVYKFNQQVTSGSGGSVTVSGMEWDTYTVSAPAASSVDIAGTYPFSPFALLPGASIDFKVLTNANSANSLLVRVKNQTDSPIASASVQLLQLNPPFIATKATGLANQPDWSQAFFDSLSVGLYNVLVRAGGYQEATASVSVSGDDIETFSLLPNE